MRATELLDVRFPQAQLSESVLDVALKNAVLPVTSAYEWGVPDWSESGWTPAPGTRDLADVEDVDQSGTFLRRNGKGDLVLWPCLMIDARSTKRDGLRTSDVRP